MARAAEAHGVGFGILPREATPATELLRDLERLPAAKARARLARHVASRVAAVLALPASATIHLRQGFFDMGMDSLTSVELRNRLEADFGCTLPPTLAMDYPNVNALADHLATQVLAIVAPMPATPERADAADRGALAQLAELSDAEAEAMLLKTLDEMKL